MVDEKAQIISELVLGQFFEYLIPYIGEAGIPLDLINHPSYEITFEQFNQLVKLAIADGHDYLGLTVGSNAKVNKFGAIGHLQLNAPDVASLLDVMSDFIPLYNKKTTINWLHQNSKVEISYHSTTAVCRRTANAKSSIQLLKFPNY